jgi:L-ascorbate metabolism protein UlaG (beta-lactamase superfamily)
VSPEAPLQLTWVGHSTVLVELGGVRLLTDPLLTDRVAHLRRHSAVSPDSADGVDGVVISHVHLDHLHLPSLRRLPRSTALIVPDGAGGLLTGRGFTDVRETRAGRTTVVGTVDVETVPARHKDRRGPHSRVRAQAVGYVMRACGRSVYFAGDTDLFAGMADIAPVEVALLPIWGWGPTIGEGHLDPGRAAEAVGILDARLVVPIHWGTLSPAVIGRRPPAWLNEPVEQFRAELGSAGLLDRLRVLAPGERLVLPEAAPL